MRQAFRKSQLELWEKMLNNIFDSNIPEKKEWSDTVSIIKVLNQVAADDALSHVFLPTRGGTDLDSCKESNEKNCIEMKLDGIARIVKPKRLIFNFNKKSCIEWAYFYLELCKLEDSGVYKNLNSDYEELVEVAPGEYEDRIKWDSYKNYYPKDSRIVIRNFQGDFAFFSKGSAYNNLNRAYDGKHSKLGYEEFETQINIAIEKFNR